MSVWRAGTAKVAIAQTRVTAMTAPNMKRLRSRKVWTPSQPRPASITAPITTDWSQLQKVMNGNGTAIRLLSHEARACPSS